MLIAAPVVQLRTWNVLVWSEAGNSEGEKGNLTSLSILLNEPHPGDAGTKPSLIQLIRRMNRERA
jgi:hypothetical protein